MKRLCEKNQATSQTFPCETLYSTLNSLNQIHHYSHDKLHLNLRNTTSNYLTAINNITNLSSPLITTKAQRKNKKNHIYHKQK